MLLCNLMWEGLDNVIGELEDGMCEIGTEGRRKGRKNERKKRGHQTYWVVFPETLCTIVISR